MTQTDKTENGVSAEKGNFFSRLTRLKPSDILKVFLLCVAAGLILAAFDIDPSDLWVDFFGTLFDAWDRFLHIITDSLGWAVRYFFLGAVLVIPIWILWRVLSSLTPPKDK